MMLTRENILKHKNWKPLGDVVEFLDHKRKPITESERKEGGYPYYGANGQQGTINDFIFEEPLILLAEDGGFFGMEGKPIAYTINGKTWVNNHAHVLKPKAGYNLDYIFRHLQFYDVSPFVNGSTRGKLTKASAEQIPVFIPNDEKKQERIANLLDKADSIRKKRRQQIKLVDDFLRATFLDMFGDPQKNQMNWETAKLGDYINLTGGNAFASTNYSSSGIPLIKIGTVNKGFLDTSNLSFWPETDSESLKKYILYPNDLVITLTGTVGKDDYGNTCFLPNTFPKYYLNQRVAKIVIKERFTLEYLHFLFKHPAVKSMLTSNDRGIRQANLSNEDIYDLKVSVPSIELQHNFSNLYKKTIEIKAINQSSLTESENLFNSLMQRAFRGEL